MKSNFKLGNKFMVRIPSYPLNMYHKLINECNQTENKIIEQICQDEYMFKEKILVSSIDLYDTLISFLGGNEVRNKDYFFNSIYKYFIRSCTRATPFGLFAGIAFGNCSNNETKFELLTDKYTKHTRPDMEWLMTLIKKIETKYFKSLSYVANEGIVKKSDRAILINSTNKHDRSKVKEISIKYTLPLDILIGMAQDYIPFNDLVSKLSNEFPETSCEHIENYVVTLIENEFLISNLRVPLVNCNVYHDFIKQLKDANIDNDLVEKLEDILNQINNYDNVSYGAKKYLDLRNCMLGVNKSNKLLQTDISYEFNELNLDKDFESEINDLLHIMLLFGAGQKQSYISQEYKNAFLEKYGEDRRVNIIELLDSNLGLGQPQNHRFMQIKEDLFNRDIRSYFAKKYCRAMKNNISSIDINDDEIKSLNLKEYDVADIPVSLELNMSVFKDNDKFVYELGAITGSTRAGKSMGRFLYLSDNPNMSFYQCHNKISCELVFASSDYRNLNVVQNYNSSDYEIALSVGNSKDPVHRIRLDDIFVGIRNNKFYAWSQSLGKELEINVNHMLDPNLFTQVFQFLYYISVDREINWYTNPWNLDDFIYMPQVRYKNFILQPERWIIDKNILGVTKKDKFESFDKAFSKFVTDFNVPHLVYFGIADNKLILNLENNRCRKILYYELINKNVRIILNTYNENLKPATKSGDESYITEIFVPVIRNSEHVTHFENMDQEIGSVSNLRLKQPFDEWLYFKLYVGAIYAEKFIAIDMPNFLNDLMQERLIDKYFFIQYVDPKDHIRLRLKSSETKLLEAYPKIKMWLADFIEREVMSGFVIDCYNREIERYGGIHLIDYAEDIFFKDSVAVSKILSLKDSGLLNFSDKIIGIISIVKYMQQFDLHLSDCLNILGQNSSLYRDEFRQNRNLYVDIVKNQLNNTVADDEHKVIMDVLNVRDKAVKIFLGKLNYQNKKQERFYIVNSLIHMNMNRLFGPDIEFENKVRIMTRNTIYSIQQMHKNRNVLANGFN